jgi:hypothetical protein
VIATRAGIGGGYDGFNASTVLYVV